MEYVESKRKIIAVIPARCGSKRIINKNLRIINGIPLIGHAIEQALSTENIDEVFVSTDSIIIGEVAKTYGAKVPFIRPEEYATDQATDLDVFKHFLHWYLNEYGEEPELLVQIRATAPIRDIMYIDKAIEAMIKNPLADSLRSVSKPHQTPYKMWKLNDVFLEPVVECSVENFYDLPTQSLPNAFGQDGFIDIIRPRTILEQNSMAGKKILGFTNHKDTLDIDNIHDLELVELIMRDRDIYKTFTPKGILAGRLGVLQGRLSESSKSILQYFPESWRDEFNKARKLGFAHLELFRDKQYNKLNPLWIRKEELIKEINEKQIETGVAVRSICDDYIMMCDWLNFNLEQFENLTDLLVIANMLKSKYVIYPLMEKANIENEMKREKAAAVIGRLCKIANALNITICIEANLHSEILINFIKKINMKNVKICLDSGNLLCHGIDPAEQIYKFKSLIGHVHIKDKNDLDENVRLGTGLLNLMSVVKALRSIEYKGFLTFETTRGNDYNESATHNREYFLKLANTGFES